MVVCSHHSLAAGMGNRLARLDPSGMRMLLLVPGSTGFGAIGTAGVLACHGGALIVTSRFNADRAIELIEQQRPTHVFGVPTMFLDMLARPALARADTSSVRVIAGGGASISASAVEQLQQIFGCVFVNRYGAASQTALDDPLHKITGTSGRPDPAVMSIRIVDEDGKDLPAAAEGEIYGDPMASRVELCGPECATGLTGEVFWRGPGIERVDTEATIQAACGLMAVHGRPRGIPCRLGVDVASVAAGVITTQGLLAALFARLRGGGPSRVETSVLQAGLFVLSHYLACATADDPEWTPPVQGDWAGPPFRTADGQLIELEALDPEAWGRWWERLDLEAVHAGRAWMGFLLRYRTATCPLPPASTRRLRAGRWPRSVSSPRRLVSVCADCAATMKSWAPCAPQPQSRKAAG